LRGSPQERVSGEHNGLWLTFVAHVQQPVADATARAFTAWLPRALSAFSHKRMLALLFQLLGIAAKREAGARGRGVSVLAAISSLRR
jgi:hypothetical protein